MKTLLSLTSRSFQMSRVRVLFEGMKIGKPTSSIPYEIGNNDTEFGEGISEVRISTQVRAATLLLALTVGGGSYAQKAENTAVTSSNDSIVMAVAPQASSQMIVPINTPNISIEPKAIPVAVISEQAKPFIIGAELVENMKGEILSGGIPVAHAYLATAVMLMKDGRITPEDPRSLFLVGVKSYFNSSEGKALLEADKSLGTKPDKKPGEGSLGAVYSIFEELFTGTKAKLTSGRYAVIRNDILPVAATGISHIRTGDQMLQALLDGYSIDGEYRKKILAIQESIGLMIAISNAEKNAELAQKNAELAQKNAELAQKNAIREQVTTNLIEFSIKKIGDPEKISREITESLGFFDRPKDTFIIPILKKFSSGDRNLTLEDLRVIQVWSKMA